MQRNRWKQGNGILLDRIKFIELSHHEGKSRPQGNHWFYETCSFFYCSKEDWGQTKKLTWNHFQFCLYYEGFSDWDSSNVKYRCQESGISRFLAKLGGSISAWTQFNLDLYLYINVWYNCSNFQYCEIRKASLPDI